MRIAVVVHGYLPEECGGVELLAHEQAEALAARGHRVHVFARSGLPGDEGAVLDDRVGSIAVRRVVQRNPPRPSFAESYEGDFLDTAFRDFLREVEPDVVHVQHLVFLSTRLPRLAAEQGIPTVLSLHDFYYLCHRLFLLDDQGRRCPGPDAGARCVPCLAELGVGEAARERFDAMARALSGLDAITAPSHFLARRYEEILPFLAGRIDVVEPGLGVVPARRERRYSEGTSDDPLRLLFVGTLLPHKGLDLLVDALERCPRERVALTIRGKVVAPHEQYVAELRERTRALPVTWADEFEPTRLEEVLTEADVLVVPSRCDESYSRVVREARAAGLVVIASDRGGPAEYLRDGEDAMLVSTDSVDALSAALERLISDPALVQRLGRAEAHVARASDAAARLEQIFARAASRRAERRSAPRPRVTVGYVTRNGERWLERSLTMVRRQRGAFELAEILAIDSDSSDATVAILERHGAKVIGIPQHEFSHGRTRNLLACRAEGDILVLLTQDACPANETWLDPLVRALEEDPLLAGAWSRHVPWPDCHPMEWRVVEQHPPFQDAVPRVHQSRGNPDYARQPDLYTAFSNNSSAFRREVLLRWPFPDVAFAEDKAWARTVLEAGWRTALVDESLVLHSHGYSAWMNLRRHFDHWRAMTVDFGRSDPFTLRDGVRAAFRETSGDLDFWARRTGQSRPRVAVRWWLQAVAYHLGAFTGRWLGARSSRLPTRLPAWLSLHGTRRAS